jgi:hypothetical protein
MINLQFAILPTMRYLLLLLVALLAPATLAGEAKKSNSPAPPQKEIFTPRASLDAGAMERRTRQEHLDREAAATAKRVAEAKAAGDDETAAALTRELERQVAAAFEHQQSMYRLENEALRKRVSAVNDAISRRDDKQQDLVAARVRQLIAAQGKLPEPPPPTPDREAQQRELFKLVAELVRVRQQVRDLQLAQGGAIAGLTDMSEYRQEYGAAVRVEVTGRTTGAIWGTGIYSDDSDISTAAVHAGLLKDGEKGLLVVKIVPSPPLFEGTQRNGVLSREYKTWPSGYTLEKANAATTATSAAATGLTSNWSNRGQLGDQYHFELTGRTDERIWGTDLYTLDSDLATAAVHAGVLKPGEKGWVVITIVKSPAKHAGSEQHGVKSFDFGPWAASFIVQRLKDLPP